MMEFVRILCYLQTLLKIVVRILNCWNLFLMFNDVFSLNLLEYLIVSKVACVPIDLKK